jgi:hypothetical protein
MRKTIFVAVTLLFLSLTGSAFASPKASKPVDDFRRTITARVESVWSRIEKKLDAHTVSTDRRKAIRQTFDDAARPIFAEVDKAGADGAISREENARIVAMTNGLRGKVRGKLATARGEAKRSESRASTPEKAPTPPVEADKHGGKKGEAPRRDGAKPASPGKSHPEGSKAAKPKDKESKSKGKAQHNAPTQDSEE